MTRSPGACLAQAGGIDVITTYVMWNLHEQNDPTTGSVSYDFSTGRRNLAGFLKAAQAADLLVFVRLGACVRPDLGSDPQDPVPCTSRRLGGTVRYC